MERDEISVEGVAALLEDTTLDDLPGYEVRRDGSVWSVTSNWRGYGARQLSAHPNSHGYLRIHAVLDGERKARMVHTLIARAFHGERPTPQHQVRHLNGCRTDNHADNLAWGTAAENAADRKLHGTERAAEIGRDTSHLRNGEKGSAAKLTDAEARAIRARWENGETSWAIAPDYPHVTPFSVNNAAKGRTFKHLETTNA